MLSGYVDAIVIRTFDDERLAALAAARPRVPVINALTDGYHPCQLLADLLTIRQLLRHDARAGRWRTSATPRINMANSYALAGAAAGMHVRIGAPAGLPARSGASWSPGAGDRVVDRRLGRRVTDDPYEAVAGADVVATDTWTSMGQETTAPTGSPPLPPYQVNAALLGAADAGRDRAALPAGAPRRGDHRRGDGRAAERGLRAGGQPAARRRRRCWRSCCGRPRHGQRRSAQPRRDRPASVVSSAA